MYDYKKIIREKRLLLGITQKDLAKTVGITQPFLYEIESGRKAPSVDILIKICMELNIQMFDEE